MLPSEYEKSIQNKRLEEAKLKKYIGREGKFGFILDAFGDSIMEQGSGGFIDSREYQNYDDAFDLHNSRNPNELMMNIPTIEVYDYKGDPIMEPADYDGNFSRKNRVHQNVEKIGDVWSNSAFEIVYLSDNNSLIGEFCHDPGKTYSNSSLKVTYKTKVVYREENNDLVSFIPGNWEKELEPIIEQAANKLKIKTVERRAKIVEENKKEKEDFIARIKSLWG